MAAGERTDLMPGSHRRIAMPGLTSRRLARCCGLLLAIAVASAPAVVSAQSAATAASPPVVFAPPGLKIALDAVVADWAKDSGKTAAISYAASSSLAQQLEQGAAADVVISAEPEGMDRLQAHQLILPETRQNLLSDSLVVIAPRDSKGLVKIVPGYDFGGVLVADRRLAVGAVTSVPAGRQAMRALERLDIWAGVEVLAQCDSVEAILAMVARGDAPFGIIYATDAMSEPQVRIVDTFPAFTRTAVLHSVALTASSRNADAAAFVAFLRSPAAARRFADQGFAVVGR
jgi:molybdate transport system substrate-binding protein